MELLLNLAWLLLALPAYVLWRSSRTGGRRNRFGSLQCLLALGCALIVLFPVISATDDLHAMRAEMEESQASKRSIRQAGTDRASAGNHRSHNPPAVLCAGEMLFTPAEHRAIRPLSALILPMAPAPVRNGRAPPAFLLG
jgi:hypothetical protein